MRLIEQTTDQRQCHRVRMTELFLLAKFARRETRLRWSECRTREIIDAYARIGDAYLSPDEAYDHLLSIVDADNRPMFGRGESNGRPWSRDTLSLLAQWLCSDRLTILRLPTTEDDNVMDIRLGQGYLPVPYDELETPWALQDILCDMPEEQAIEIDALKLVMWIYGSYPTEVIENPIKTFNDEFNASMGNEGLDPKSRLGRMSQEEFAVERTAAEVAGTLTSKFRKMKSRTTMNIAKDILQEFGDTFRLPAKAMLPLGVIDEDEDPCNITWVRASAAECLEWAYSGQKNAPQRD